MTSNPTERAPRRRWPTALGALLLAGYFVAINLSNLEVGRADNGDWTRVAGHWIRKPQGFAVNAPAMDDPAWSRRYFGCWLRYWERQSDPAAVPPPTDLSSTRFLWFAAFALAGAFSSPETFDLLYLGVLVRTGCLALLLLFYATAASHLRGRPWWIPLLIAAPLAASLADPRLTTFFNTFYREPGSVLYALLAVTGLLALSGGRFWGPAALAAGGAALLATSASAHFFTAPLMAAALSAVFLRRRRRAGPSPAGGLGGGAAWLGIAALVAMLLAAGASSERRTDRGLRKNAAFHTLFHGALLLSGEPERHLAFLGLPAQAKGLIGAHAFLPESRRFILENWNRLGHRATARVLLREPALIPRMLRQGGLTLHDAAAAFEMGRDAACSARMPRLAWWTALKAKLLPRGYPLLALLAAAALAAIAAALRRDARLSAVGLALAFTALGALGEIAVNVFGDGFFELPRHLLLASFLTDLALALSLWLAALAAGGAAPAPPRSAARL